MNLLLCARTRLGLQCLLHLVKIFLGESGYSKLRTYMIAPPTNIRPGLVHED
jgi:hypothetical protein